MHFGEYELSPSLISLSPLPTAHRQNFQLSCVRTSTTCYGRFILAMGRSPGFASAPCNSIALFGLAFAAAAPLNGLTLLHRTTRQLIMQKARGHSAEAELPLLVSKRFQVLFHSPPGVLFTFPSRYWFTIGHERVFSLG